MFFSRRSQTYPNRSYVDYARVWFSAWWTRRTRLCSIITRNWTRGLSCSTVKSSASCPIQQQSKHIILEISMKLLILYNKNRINQSIYRIQILYFSFGVSPVLDEIRHQGVMRTKCDDCQFVLVKQNDYFEILNQVN